MTDPTYTHVLLIVDRSGSMASIRPDMEGGINQFIKDQAAGPGRATVSLRQFDTAHDEVFSFAPAATAPEYSLVPRGSTALLDAVGAGIAKTGEDLAAMPEDERPGLVVVLIATDGCENASCEYNRAAVRASIERQESDYGWKFTYLGANQDSFAEAGSIGIPAAAVMDYSADSAGTKGAFASASDAVLKTRGGGSLAYGALHRSAAKGGN